MTSKILPMGIANTGFLIDRLGTDCGPLQYIRELTQNSIEAIERANQPNGEIVWDVDWELFSLIGARKLSISDNGIGMTGDDMVRFINQLSSSAGVQSDVTNYGVGAKIAAATRNPYGLVYQSWYQGEGSMVQLWKNEEGQYGLRQFQLTDGSIEYVSVPRSEFKPDMIGPNGTKVVLLGTSERDDTSAAPSEDTPSPSMWLTRYLNTRYFQLPDNIALRVRENTRWDVTPVEKGKLRKITGMRDYLENNSSTSGTVELKGANAHWWIYSPEIAPYDHVRHASNGHTAALYQNELYEMTTAGKANIAALQQFGITFGYSKVVIYLEPTDLAHLTTNTARSDLLLNKAKLPWSDWQAEFRQKMPTALREHVIRSSPKSDPQRIATKITKRIEEMGDLIAPSAYRLIKIPDPSDARNTGTKIGVEATRVPGSERMGTSNREAGPGEHQVVDVGGVYALFAKGQEQAGRPVNKTVIPDLKWISVLDNTRQQGDLEDRAARYIADQNILLINADFRILTDLIKHYVKQYRNDASRHQMIVETIREWYQQQLIEAIVGAQGLSNSPTWNREDTARMLSEESLTLAIMPRYLLVKRLNGSLGVKFGAAVEEAPLAPEGKAPGAAVALKVVPAPR